MKIEWWFSRPNGDPILEGLHVQDILLIQLVDFCVLNVCDDVSIFRWAVDYLFFLTSPLNCAKATVARKETMTRDHELKADFLENTLLDQKHKHEDYVYVFLLTWKTLKIHKLVIIVN